MARKFSPITADDLKRKIEEAYENDPADMLEKLAGDLKVEFDPENFEDDDSSFDPKFLMGYHTLSNGLTFCGMCAGGDWEHPVFFIVYWDGKKLRAYVPTDGNPWNTTTKRAYGNDDGADLKNARKRWPDLFKGRDEIEPGDFDFEWELIRADIEGHFAPAEGSGKPKPRSLQERVEGLTYFGTGDEAYELFRRTCSFCHHLHGLGMDDKAAVVCGWAEEMAADSNTAEADPDDTTTGVWGEG
jgi:hypothetical protein